MQSATGKSISFVELSDASFTEMRFKSKRIINESDGYEQKLSSAFSPVL